MDRGRTSETLTQTCLSQSKNRKRVVVKNDTIIIIGAGISGITTGLVLQLLGYSTVIYTEEKLEPEDFYLQGDPEFASRYPAASVIPHMVFTNRLESLFLQSQKIFYRLFENAFEGLTLHKHYEVFEFDRKHPAYLDCMFNVRELEGQNDLPRRSSAGRLYGWVFNCFFTDWPVYYPHLSRHYLEAGGEIRKRALSGEDIPELPAEIIINCSGLGSRRLFDDDVPHELGRGHLLYVRDAPIYRNQDGEVVSYNYTPTPEVYSGQDGDPVDVYWYPRQDGWILGGSRQFGTVDESGRWNGGKFDGETYERNGIAYPRQIWDLNRDILEQSYGLNLEKYGDVIALKGYRYIRSRNNGLRIESEEIEDRYVVHNYGHGGAGITLSWGAALEVVRILISDLNHMPADKKRTQKLNAGILPELHDIIESELEH